MALKPRQLADEIEATLAEGRFSSLKRIYDDMNEPRVRTAYDAESLLRAADALPQQWQAQLAKAQDELATELKREAAIKEEREARVLKYQEELLRLESAADATEERQRVETAVLKLREENSAKSLRLIDGALHQGLSADERKQQLALHFAQQLPIDIEAARTRCKTPARAWHSVGLLSNAEPQEPFVPIISKHPALEMFLNSRATAQLKQEEETPYK